MGSVDFKSARTAVARLDFPALAVGSFASTGIVPDWLLRICLGNRPSQRGCSSLEAMKREMILLSQEQRPIRRNAMELEGGCYRTNARYVGEGDPACRV